jgi:cobalt-zinc-cadmium efflux system protein
MALATLSGGAIRHPVILTQAPFPMSHGHDHHHGHGGHSHAVSADANRRQLAIALGLILGLMVLEVAVGLVADSLALISDAAHMLTDAVAIGLSLWAASLATRPAKGSLTYGYRRAEILAAQFNGATLLTLAVLIVIEAVRRLASPPSVEATLILAVAVAGVVVNLLATWVLAKANRVSLNVEGSFQHIVTDLYAVLGTAIAAIVILASGFERADPIASLFVAALMLRAAYGLLKASGRIFLEAAPEGMDVDEIGTALAGHVGVVEVHDLHVWEVTSGFPSLSAHILVESGADCHGIREQLEGMIDERFGIHHTTLQVEHRKPRLVQLSSRRPRRRAGGG